MVKSPCANLIDYCFFFKKNMAQWKNTLSALKPLKTSLEFQIPEETISSTLKDAFNLVKSYLKYRNLSLGKTEQTRRVFKYLEEFITLDTHNLLIYYHDLGKQFKYFLEPEQLLRFYRWLYEGVRLNSLYPSVYNDLFIQEYAKNYFQPFFDLEPERELDLEATVKTLSKIFFPRTPILYSIRQRTPAAPEDVEDWVHTFIRYHIHARTEDSQPLVRNREKFLELAIRHQNELLEIGFDIGPWRTGIFRFYRSAKFHPTEHDPKIYHNYVKDYLVKPRGYTEWRVYEKPLGVDSPEKFSILPLPLELNSITDWSLFVEEFERAEFSVYNTPSELQYLSLKSLTFDWRPKVPLDNALIPLLAGWKDCSTVDDADLYFREEIYPVFCKYAARVQDKVYMLEPTGIYLSQNSERGCVNHDPTYTLKEYNELNFKKHTYFSGHSITVNTEEVNGKRRRVIKALGEMFWNSGLAKHKKQAFGYSHLSLDQGPVKFLNFYSGPGCWPDESLKFVQKYPYFSRVCWWLLCSFIKDCLVGGIADPFYKKWSFGAVLHMLKHLTHDPTNRGTWHWVPCFIGEPGSGKGILQKLESLLVGSENSIANSASGKTGVDAIFGHFNSATKNKVLICLDECQEINAEQYQRLKSGSTEHFSMVEAKHQDLKKEQQTFMVQIFANRFNAIFDENDRRFWICETRTHKDPQFYKVLAEYLFDRGGWKAIAFYLYTLKDNVGFNWTDAPVCGAAKKRIFMKNRDRVFAVLVNAAESFSFDNLDAKTSGFSSRIKSSYALNFLEKNAEVVGKPHLKESKILNRWYDQDFVGSTVYGEDAALATLDKITCGYGFHWPAFLPVAPFLKTYGLSSIPQDFLRRYEDAWLKYEQDKFGEDLPRRRLKEKLRSIDGQEFTCFFSLQKVQPNYDPNASQADREVKNGLILEQSYNNQKPKLVYYNDVVLCLPKHQDSKDFFDSIYSPVSSNSTNPRVTFPVNWDKLSDFIAFVGKEQNSGLFQGEEDEDDFYDSMENLNLSVICPLSPYKETDDPLGKFPKRNEPKLREDKFIETKLRLFTSSSG